MRFNNLIPVVKNVLEKYEVARTNDNILIYLTIKELKVANGCKTSLEVFQKSPPFETITRIRRKLQSEFPELANEKVKKAREASQKDYIELNRRKINGI